MAINTFQTLNVIEAMENFLSRIRPPEDIRHQLDIGYKIEQQSIIVFEIRPKWNKPDIILEHSIAKATYVKSKNNWTIFVMVEYLTIMVGFLKSKFIDKFSMAVATSDSHFFSSPCTILFLWCANRKYFISFHV